MFKNEGINIYHLKPSISTYERKEVIEKNKDKYDVFISHPKLVNVGINLIFCPTFIVYIPSYQVNIVSQAIRRGYRLILLCKIGYITYIMQIQLRIKLLRDTKENVQKVKRLKANLILSLKMKVVQGQLVVLVKKLMKD